MPVPVEAPPLTKDIVLAQIPAFPPVVLRVLELLANEETDTAVLVREMASDATMSAQLLRLANSPLFGLAAQVDTVHHAVVTLGRAHVESLVISVATTNYLKAAMGTDALQKCWRHTVASAILCRELARATGLHADRAYSFGLLHDIGRLGLLVAYPDDYQSVLHAADRDAVSLLDLEKKRFGMDHCEAGRRLVEQWKLPQEFCVIAGRHHDRPSGAPVDFLTLVHASCQLADTFGYSVVKPLREVSFEEIRSLLPADMQGRLPDRPEVYAEILAGAIDPEQSPSHVPIVERIANLPEKPPAVTSPAPGPPETGNAARLFATLESGPTAWELPVILVTTLLILAALGAASYLWNG